MARPVEITLYLDAETPTISGTAEDASGVTRAFYGWLELSAYLDSVLAPYRLAADLNTSTPASPSPHTPRLT